MVIELNDQHKIRYDSKKAGKMALVPKRATGFSKYSK